MSEKIDYCDCGNWSGSHCRPRYCARQQLRDGNAAAREVFTEEKYPLDPRIVAARQNKTT